MKNKSQRLTTIREIIKKEEIRSQEEIQNRLLDKGFHITQATLSRDLKELRIARIADSNNGYLYIIPGNNSNSDQNTHTDNFAGTGFLSLEFSNKMGVMKTLPGYANGIAYSIDNLDRYEILATIAGDDTILIIPRENVTEKDIREVLSDIIPEIHNTSNNEKIS